MVTNLSMVKFAAFGSEAVASKAFVCTIAKCFNIFSGGSPSRALAETYRQCSISTSQSTISRDIHSG